MRPQRIGVLFAVVASSLTFGDVAEARSAQRCSPSVYDDARGDAPIDIARIEITSDCSTHRFVLTTHRPFSNAQLGRWGVAIGPSDSSSNGCDGMSHLIEVTGRSGRLTAASATWFDCDRLYDERRAVVKRLSPRSIAVTVSTRALAPLRPGESYRWQAFTARSSGGAIDLAPPTPTLVVPPPVKPRPEVRSSADGSVVEVTWEHSGRVSGFDLRYREVGGEWSTKRRLGHLARDAVIEGLRPGTEYQIGVTAVSGGSTSAEGTARIRHLARPGPPTNLRAASEGDPIVVRFDPPDFDGGHTRLLTTAQIEYADGTVESASSRGGAVYIWTTDVFPIVVHIRAHASSATRGWASDWVSIRLTGIPPAG
jgi:hypothetical protein